MAGQLRSAWPGIAHGMGRSYGDACLNPDGVLWFTAGLDRFISFDPVSGSLSCEAGVLLRDIQRLVVPHGWMLPVSPGTQFVTVGGAIANDIHGKNHHAVGTFGDHVTRLVLQRTDGEVIECGPTLCPAWFAATLGGVGLTGVIVSAELQLRPVRGPWLDTETIPFDSLERFFQLSGQSEQDWEYTVSWIDCLAGERARGLFMRANHAVADEPAPPRRRTRHVPFTPPVPLINGLSLRAFNAAYFRMGQWRAGASRQHYQAFFYPLDNLLEWNRIYGPRGFFQYQCVVPFDNGVQVTRDMLKVIARSGRGSFLAVLKTFGQRSSPGMLSFPLPGVTLALDFANTGPEVERLFVQLDGLVAEAGGRLYLAKDARMPRSLFEAGYPRLQEFLAYRDPGMSSELSRRLMGV
ncbi:MAG: FAD-binding oxidoreductase [Pseudomonadota bacterium]|nr:FAD-binding oxidoreductase [Pseudomonadota bacterium]